MEISLEQYEKIQDYLDGRMKPQEEEDFLIQIETNIFLKENFEFEKELRQNIVSILDKKDLFEKQSIDNEAEKDFNDTASIKSLIKKAGIEWEEENKEILHPVAENIPDIKHRQQKGKVINLRSWIVIVAAACIAFAIISVVWFMQRASSPELVKTNETRIAKKDSNNNMAKTNPNDSTSTIHSPAKKINYIALFKKYYAKDKDNPEMPDLLAAVPENYKNGDYSFRKINLDNIPVSRGSSKDKNSRQNILQLGHYYKGLSYIETNSDKKAIEQLKWVIENARNEKIKIKAQWYLALIYLKSNENKKAVPLLFSLSKNGTAIPYNKKARNILLAIDTIQNHD
jgi:hypothetical protein